MISTQRLTAFEKRKTWPKGRVCGFMDEHGHGCTTPLSIHNGTRFCGMHGGWQTCELRALNRRQERERFMAEVVDIMAE